MDEYFRANELNEINSALLETVEPKPLEEKKIEKYKYYLQSREYNRRYRERHRESYNEAVKLKMREYYKNNPQYKEKQSLLYYRKRYGVDTKEEAQLLKQQLTKEENLKLLEKYKEESKTKPNTNQKRGPIDFEAYFSSN